jgi:hypothetical protein
MNKIGYSKSPQLMMQAQFKNEKKSFHKNSPDDVYSDFREKISHSRRSDFSRPKNCDLILSENSEDSSKLPLKYSFPIGTALAPLPKVGPLIQKASILPSMFYIGSDVYDSYKKGGTDCKPSLGAGIAQAFNDVFTGIIAPGAVVIGAQKLADRWFSNPGKEGKSMLDKAYIKVGKLKDQFIDKTDVKTHVSQILNKLDDNSITKTSAIQGIQNIVNEVPPGLTDIKGVKIDLKDVFQKFQNNENALISGIRKILDKNKTVGEKIFAALTDSRISDKMQKGVKTVGKSNLLKVMTVPVGIVALLLASGSIEFISKSLKNQKAE